MMDFYTLQLYFLANMVKAIVLYEAPAAAEADSSMDIDDEYEQEIKNLPEKLQENIILFYRKYNIPARRKAYAETLKKHQELGLPASNTQSTTTATTTASLDVLEDTNMSTDEATSSSSASAGDIPNVIIECSLKTIAGMFEHIRCEMQEFLRCCCLFFHFVTDVDFPDDFSSSGSDTFENMCNYLGLQTSLGSYFDNESAHATTMLMFASHPDILFYDLANNCRRGGEEFKMVPCNGKVPQLVSLPDDYSDLINSVSDFICPNSEREEMKTPTMCLICGEMLCGQSYCCQPELESRNVGACTYHAHFCGAEIGLFLRIRDCQIVYLGRNKGCLVLPPYLDEYGETDQGLRRGNPLRLCPARYSKIHLTWLGHGLHEEIARLNDNSSVVTQWHHM